ncbi:MAG: hypothetical protein U9Q03_03525 [Patescibacteria group bacterium]|nr:hypothetical protein [Patescibacteria group bacterium]
MSSEIEGRAASLQVADELRPYVDAWQAIIMNHYGLSESEMGNMFLLADVIHFPKQSSGRMTVSIRYVVKAGDVYFKPLSLDFEARADEVGQMTGAQIKDYLIGKYVAQSLDAEDPTQQIIVMDGINLGLAKSAINQVSQKSCAQYATLLKSCDAVVKPIDFIIKPGLNKAWLSAGGRSGDQCYSATVDLFSSQVDCGRPTPCSI